MERKVRIAWIFAGLLILVAVATRTALYYHNQHHQGPSDSLAGVVASPSTCNVGLLAAGAKVAAAFSILNGTAAPVEIAEITPECACTVADGDHQVIAPQQQATVKLVINTSEFSMGPFRKAAICRLNSAGGSKPISLTVYGSISPADTLLIFPGRLNLGASTVDGLTRSVFLCGAPSAIGTFPESLAVELRPGDITIGSTAAARVNGAIELAELRRITLKFHVSAPYREKPFVTYLRFRNPKPGGGDIVLEIHVNDNIGSGEIR